MTSTLSNCCPRSTSLPTPRATPNRGLLWWLPLGYPHAVVMLLLRFEDVSTEEVLAEMSKAETEKRDSDITDTMVGSLDV